MEQSGILRWLVLLVLAWPAADLASTEIPAGYDATSTAMGGTGSAFIENGASTFHNPALLTGVHRFVLTLGVLPTVTVYTTPLNGPGTAVRSDAAVFPLVFLGGGLRLSDRLVIGFAAYPIAGYGSGYSDVASLGGQGLRLGVFAVEMAPAVAVRLSRRWSLGLAYRVTFAYQSSDSPSPAGTTKTTLSGFNLFGLHGGVTFQATDDLTLAFTARTGVTTDISGSTKVDGSEVDTRSQFATPPVIKFGAALRLFDRSLLLALDAKYLFYRSSSQRIVTALSTAEGKQTIVTPLEWRNVASLSIGAEYRIASRVRLRTGYFLGGSATPGSTAGFFTPPPGLAQAVSGGAGLDLGRWDLALGAIYSFVGGDADPTRAVPPNPPGRYHVSSVSVALSASYHN